MAINEMAADMPQLANDQAGFINDPSAMPPQEGGEMSVADDIPAKTNEESFILPYESVLLAGLNQLNRYAKEAVKLAKDNDVDLSQVDVNPEDDVPIRISNYEYHIPNALVPFFGGGLKYLNKLQKEGIDFRNELKDKGQPPAIQEQQMAAPQMSPEEEQELAQVSQQVPEEASPAMPLPQEEGMMPLPQEEGMIPLPQEAPMMMQKGGFVLSKDQDAALLEKDEAPTTQEQTRLKAQQPAMITPDGKRVKQGFSAPAGYANGGDVMKGLGFKLEDVNRYNVGGMVKNAEDAVNMLNGIKSSFDREDKEMQRAQKKRGFA